MRRFRLERLLVVGLVLWGAPSVAEPSSAPAARRAAATQRLKRGLELFRSHDFVHAIEEFRAGYESDPRADFLFAIAQAQRLQGQCAEAARTYREFLLSDPPRRQALMARRLIERCEQATLSPPTSPSPAQAVQPRPTDERAPEEAVETAEQAAVSTQMASVERSGVVGGERNGIARPAVLTIEPRVVAPEAVPVPETTPVVTPEPERERGVARARGKVGRERVWYRDGLGWGLGAGGVAAVCVGAGLFGAGQGWVSDARAAGDYQTFANDAGRAADGARMQAASVGLFVAGGVLVAAAAVRMAMVGKRR